MQRVDCFIGIRIELLTSRSIREDDLEVKWLTLITQLCIVAFGTLSKNDFRRHLASVEGQKNGRWVRNVL